MLKSKYSRWKYECGTDEAGRGCLAGPVTAAAVILSEEFRNKNLNDSKKLNEFMRVQLRPLIEKDCIEFAVSHVDADVIDDVNILNASIQAMHQCVDQLSKVEFIAVDGNRFKPYNNIPFATLIKGDGSYLNIAAASVLAKTYRDDYMRKIHEEFPMYNWKQNKGYPTPEHRAAIKKYGITKYHRRSFRLLPEQLTFEF